MTQIILGIDPGSRKTGYGVVLEQDGVLSYIGSGVIKTGDGPLYERLLVIYESVEQIINQFRPEVLAIEETFLSQNVQSTIKLSEARSVAMVACAKAGMPVYEYGPRQIKQALTGQGGADKQQVQFMVKKTLGLNGLPQVDASDALACAICHGVTISNPLYQALQKASKEDNSDQDSELKN